MLGVIKRSKDDNEGLQPLDFFGYQILRSGDLVFKLIDLQNTSTSRIGLSPYTGIVSPAYICITSKENMISAYAEKYFLSLWYRNIFNQLGDSGVRSSLNVGELMSIPIPVPSLEEQNRIASFLDTKCAEIDALTADIQKEIETLQEYRKSVITEAVTKGLDPDVEMKDSGVYWLGLHPATWNLSRVKYHLCERKEYSLYGMEEPLSMSQKKGLIPTSEMDVIPNAASSLIGAKIAHVDDLVFNKLKAHLGVFSVSQYYGLVSPDYAVYYAKNYTTAKFFEYLFKTSKYITEFRKCAMGVGAGLTRLYTGDLFSIHCALPSDEEMYLIVEYLNGINSEIDSIIADKQKQLENLTEYRKSLIYEYVTGKKEVPTA